MLYSKNGFDTKFEVIFKECPILSVSHFPTAITPEYAETKFCQSELLNN